MCVEGFKLGSIKEPTFCAVIEECARDYKRGWNLG